MPRKRCFVISPIGTKGTTVHRNAQKVLDQIIKPACAELEVTADRGDAKYDSGKITEKILRMIREYDLCIVDLSGQNPNVFYELAIAQAWRRPVVLILKAGQEIPFDVRDYDVLRYDLRRTRIPEHVEGLRQRVAAVLKNKYKPPKLPGVRSGLDAQRSAKHFKDARDGRIITYLRPLVSKAEDVTIFSTSFTWVDDRFEQMLRKKRETNREVLLFMPQLNDTVKGLVERTGIEVRRYDSAHRVRFTLTNRLRTSGQKLRVGQEVRDAGFVITDFEQHQDSELLGAMSALIETVKKRIPPWGG